LRSGRYAEFDTFRMEVFEPDLWLRCAWCGRYQAGNAWVSFGPSERPPVDRTTHGICPACLEVQHRAAEERQARRAAGGAA
jgi:hypothetical protein